mmetsp:Transcript_32642/g.75136  ORF Transcript_32642/g.75136 Transcript_32642/m.75136 type:complete len:434 (-) Transcript_32642:395-1696(-)|eukprot:CAMPEP_0113309800 /NCGR_PEP_ID=MMETSP0010_2-20120614/7697_1 /TAXON_ID=216773 ORGANISM="Corethron hystrix, Strain 308" /NCGR_SAMPLE_ID=MMETSP0010_2 /ASSEMBLY_ACC=CAM_ASM_000155 /LENGTH=433 /DNA_ID=CAMNT_0000165121 /DNA_START=82 /DNA_END=1383 /DNA_ORIENTATION=+ /assembly_acc=CAM_ASM_000155
MAIVKGTCQLISDTINYYRCLSYFFSKTGDYESCPYFSPSVDDNEKEALRKRYARIHLYSLALIFYLWDKPHYRKGSYQNDLSDNLRNVAIPGTGIPLSIFVCNRYVALFFILLVYPLVSFIAAAHLLLKKKSFTDFADEYSTRILTPNDWFSFWRLNCRVVALHAFLNHGPVGYEMENKWTFLEEGDKRDVPVSPFLTCSGIVVKHKNEEGGMGISFYKNATAGGDWIIQERISNSKWVSSLLPDDAPLSTFRVITSSRASIDLTKKPKADDICALSCVFRAGRAGAATDHDSILFDIDSKTGEIQKGTTNAHWYRLGLHEALPGRCPWRSTHDVTHHPDSHTEITGKKIPDMKGMLALVEKSHLKMCPDVPLVGWDVVLSADENLPVCLLEVNLSCNFFRGRFDLSAYIDYLDDMFKKLDIMRRSSKDKLN